MAASGIFAYKNWKAGAWTPRRCAVWNVPPEEPRKAFEQWVEAEKKAGSPHAEEVPAEHRALLPEGA